MDLAPHPDSPSAAVTRLEAEVVRAGPRTLALRYVLSGRTDEVALPSPAPARRADELWKHTCFEAFVGTGGEAYYEFNLAPSGDWAAYRLDGYRAGLRSPDAIDDPRIVTRREADRFVLEASFDLAALPDLPADQPWRLGLTAVIEETSGARSYWALAHAPGKPDFHHPDCFASTVPAPGQP